MSFAAGAFSGGVRGGDGGGRGRFTNKSSGTPQQGMSGSEAQLHQTGVSGSQGMTNIGGSGTGGREQSYDLATGLFQHQTQIMPEESQDGPG